MGTVERYSEEIRHFMSVISSCKSLIPGELEFKVDRILDTYSLIFERFCPYKIGDEVILTKTPEISKEKSWGWLGAKHFLIEGARGIIHSRDYSKESNLFSFGVKFYEDSFLHYKTGEVIMREPHERGIYGFTEDYLTKARSE